jgi:hypothetical protein
MADFSWGPLQVIGDIDFLRRPVVVHKHNPGNKGITLADVVARSCIAIRVHGDLGPCILASADEAGADAHARDVEVATIAIVAGGEERRGCLVAVRGQDVMYVDTLIPDQSIDALEDAVTFGWIRFTAILKHDPNPSSKDGTVGVFVAESLVYAEHEGFTCQSRVAHLGALGTCVSKILYFQKTPPTDVAPFSL